jgi:transcription elongation factor GreB
MESLESQNAGFPPFPLLLEIPSGFPHFQRFGDGIIFKTKISNQLLVGRKGLVTDVSGPQRNACPGTLKMRKGFTRKPQADEPATQVKNYITPSGLQRLKDEHRFLLTRDRPAVVEVVAWAAGNGDRSENADYQYGKRRLRQIDGRIRFLAKRIEAAEVVDPEAPRAGQRAMRAFFGATVRYANAAGAERVVSIVGTDEVDLNRNHISWVSPLGRALMKSAAGDSVVLEAPGGAEDLTVMEVRYERISVEPFREPPGSEASVKVSRRRSRDEEETIRHKS